MKPFRFQDELPASKSLLNRALVVASYFPNLKIGGDSVCDDVTYMRRGLSQLLQQQTVDCGQAGTVFRFLALRAARLPGRHRLTGHAQLMARPQQELLPILGQLGVQATLTPDGLLLQSQDWHLMVDGLQINATRSSQFASAVVLNAWDLPFPLHFQVSRQFVSEGYFRMTVELCRQLGMSIIENRSREGQTEFVIPAHQKVLVQQYFCEPDISSAFVVAALAAVGGEAHILGFPLQPLQPDALFVSILRDMGVRLNLNEKELSVYQCPSLRPVQVDLQNSPDLFPVLAVLCALANGPSKVSGVSHLRYKESSRLEKTRELLQHIGAAIQGDDNEVTISPATISPAKAENFDFDTADDHRMVMAAQVLRQAGYPVNILKIGSVTKSFPEFQKLIEASV